MRNCSEICSYLIYQIIAFNSNVSKKMSICQLAKYKIIDNIAVNSFKKNIFLCKNFTFSKFKKIAKNFFLDDKFNLFFELCRR